MRCSEEKAEVRKEILKSGRTTSQNKNIKTLQYRQYRENKKDREREVMQEHIFSSTHSHCGLIKAS